MQKSVPSMIAPPESDGRNDDAAPNPRHGSTKQRQRNATNHVMSIFLSLCSRHHHHLLVFEKCIKTLQKTGRRGGKEKINPNKLTD